MKHVIITLTYTMPMEEIDKFLIEHRAFLDLGYEKGMLLASGPQNPREGGIVLARGETIEEIKEFCKNDPFYQNKCAEYKFTEYIPVKYQKEFKSWFLPNS